MVFFRSPRLPGSTQRRPMLFLWFIFLILSIYALAPIYILFKEFPTATEHQKQLNLIGSETEKSSNEGGELMSRIDDIQKAIARQAELLQTLQADANMKGAELERLLKSVDKETRLRQYYETIAQQQDGGDKQQTEPASVKKIYPSLPASSIWCYGSSKKDRFCRFKNLYYHPKHEAFFAVISENSAIVNVPRDQSPALLDLTSLEDHSVFYFKYQEVKDDQFRNVQVELVPKRAFLFSRFHVGNIMHTLHDDILGLYAMTRQFSPTNNSRHQPSFADFSTDHVIQFLDGNEQGMYDYVYSLFTSNPLRYYSRLNSDRDRITLFRDAIVGQTKSMSWYHYGFTQPQGPIENKNVSGTFVRQAADYIKYRLDIIDPVEKIDYEEPDTIVIFSRRGNRLIVNEDELKQTLERTFKLQVKFLRMEEHSFKQQVEVLNRAKIALGMHGSMLIMTLFMPKGSALVEMYPFAVPSENYSPYKTMCRLEGMNIIYRAWENRHEDRNIMHPDRSIYEGGINHLPEEERQKIIQTRTVPKHLCCTDPYWLFRIYQDTNVTVPEVEKLISNALAESATKRLSGRDFDPNILPSTIKLATIQCSVVMDNERFKGVLLSWETPWNNIKPDRYEIWEHLAYKQTNTDENSVLLIDTKYDFGAKLEIWVRWVKRGIVGPFSPRAVCTIPTPEPKEEEHQ